MLAPELGPWLLFVVLVGIVIAAEAIDIITAVTGPLLGSFCRWLPWRRAADRRAEELLREVVSRDEFATLCLRGYLEVVSPSRPDRVYRIPRRRGTIDVFEQGRYHSTLCIAPVAALPDDDIVAAQKLMILADEPRFLNVANRVEGHQWHEAAAAQRPRRRTKHLRVLRLALATLITMIATVGLLLMVDLPNTHEMLVMLLIGWPAALAALVILAGLGVFLLGITTRPRRGNRRANALASRRLS